MRFSGAQMLYAALSRIRHLVWEAPDRFRSHGRTAPEERPFTESSNPIDRASRIKEGRSSGGSRGLKSVRCCECRRRENSFKAVTGATFSQPFIRGKSGMKCSTPSCPYTAGHPDWPLDYRIGIARIRRPLGRGTRIADGGKPIRNALQSVSLTCVGER